MIAKKYRLTEREVRKVLSRRRPFFSYMFTANIFENREENHRIGIMLSSKVARGSVNRNFWRRRFYDISFSFLHGKEGEKHLDIVLVPKKGIILDKKNIMQIDEFEKNVHFLFKTIYKNTPLK